MGDLVDRLRDKWQHSEELCYEAADEIEILRKALDRPSQAAVDAFRMDQAQGRSLQSSLAKAFKAALGE